MLHKIITRMMKLLIRRGVLVEEEGSTYMADNDGDSDEADSWLAETWRLRACVSTPPGPGRRRCSRCAPGGQACAQGRCTDAGPGWHRSPWARPWKTGARGHEKLVLGAVPRARRCHRVAEGDPHIPAIAVSVVRRRLIPLSAQRCCAARATRRRTWASSSMC